MVLKLNPARALFCGRAMPIIPNRMQWLNFRVVMQGRFSNRNEVRSIGLLVPGPPRWRVCIAGWIGW